MNNTIQEWAVKTALVIFAILSPVKPVMIAVAVLVFLDFCTGVYASMKRKNPITSYKMRRTIAKTLAYQGAIIFGFVMETYLLPELPTVKVIGGLIALTEGKSFFENLHAITGVDFLKEIMDRVQGKPLDIVEKLKEVKKENDIN